MKNAATVILLALGLTACGDDQAPGEAADLFARIMSENYQSFQTAPGYESPRASNAPHSDSTQVFVNSVVADALASPTPLTSWPIGSLIVKDGYDSDGELDIIAAMEKRDDGWFWVEWFEPTNEEAKYSGKPALCIDCHVSGSDSVLAFGLPNPK